MAYVTVTVRIPARRAQLLALLESLVMLDRLYLREERSSIGATSSPSIYSRGVRYQREARDPMTGARIEHWKTIPEIVRDRVGDCEDLATARVAELREQGINARPFLTRKGKLWHVQVQLPSGELEDPSRRLGMTGFG